MIKKPASFTEYQALTLRQKQALWEQDQQAKNTPPTYMACPFCAETDFDKEGLATHIANGWCAEYVRIVEGL